MRIHLIAICGTGMGALAGLLRRAGHDVRGSDENVYPPMSNFLERERIPVFSGYRPENLDWGPERIVVGNACRRDHVEVLAARSLGFPLASFPATLADLFLEERHPVVVAGTHGKTTTTSLVAWLLSASGRDPSLLVGGITRNFDSSFLYGSGEHFVVEGDEYDTAFFDKGPKFLHYQPRTLLVTGVEFDHADIYSNVEEIVERFEQLVGLVPPMGTVLLCAENARALGLRTKTDATVLTYGLSENADVHPVDVRFDTSGVSFGLEVQGEHLGAFQSPMVGRHNLQNAVGALGVCLRLGVAPDELREALPDFAGVRRRQEVLGTPGGIRVIDDFAHHPTAVRETIAALNEGLEDGRLIVLFEPRTNTSRRAFFQSQYADALSGADLAVIASPYGVENLPPEDRFDAERLVRELGAQGVDAHHFASVDEIVRFVADTARLGDIVACMSNGGFGGIHAKLLAALGS